MSAGQTYYNAYVADVTKKNVQPIKAEQGKWPEFLEGETWETPTGKAAMSPAWGDLTYGSVKVSLSSKGRVMEVQSIWRGMSFIVAIHRTEDDYRNFRRAMPINMYLWA